MEVREKALKKKKSFKDSDARYLLTHLKEIYILNNGKTNYRDG